MRDLCGDGFVARAKRGGVSETNRDCPFDRGVHLGRGADQLGSLHSGRVAGWEHGSMGGVESSSVRKILCSRCAKQPRACDDLVPTTSWTPVQPRRWRYSKVKLNLLSASRPSPCVALDKMFCRLGGSCALIHISSVMYISTTSHNLAAVVL
eukprot:symbB.v1.2.024159.t1/scaffold2264.1/size174359/14